MGQAFQDEAEGVIKIGDRVALVSDAQKIGDVVAVNGERLTVILDGKRMRLYREQVTLVEPEAAETLDAKEALAAMTAWQINNPVGTSLFSLGSARIDFEPYQFRPVLAMIKSDSARLLIADDVGLGKTIEAGLILKELEARKAISRILVICPRALVTERKWEIEMRRFDEDFMALDSTMFATAQSETDMEGVWPAKFSKAILPYSLFTEESVAGTKTSDNGGKTKSKRYFGLERLDPAPHFDLVIVDEAHTIRNPATWWCRAVRVFCDNADAVVFMTATPLQNKDDDLYTLLNILRQDIITDKDTFAKMAEPNQVINAIVRDLRSSKKSWQADAMAHISAVLRTTWGRRIIAKSTGFNKLYEILSGDKVTREQRVSAISIAEGLHTFSGIMTRTRRSDIDIFCKRRGQTIKTTFSDDEQVLYDALMEFEKSALSILHGPNVAFMMCTFKRQAASCIRALVPFIEDTLDKRIGELEEFVDYDEGSDITVENSAVDILSKLKDKIIAIAANLPDADAKFDKLLEFVQSKQSEENRRVIIFSSFRRTLSYIQERLEKAGIRASKIDGATDYEERRSITGRFRLEKDESEAIDVVLFSEVGSEGLDYQFCDAIVNYDLPWNPMRIEQRIGRIDRRGQKSAVVRICNMIVDGTIDADIYEKCFLKIGVFNNSIGGCDEILGKIASQINKIMLTPNLTESEKCAQLEQMSDNKIRAMQESQRLEEDEKLLYGVDVSQDIAQKEVQGARNEWVSSEGLSLLVDVYLYKRLEGLKYISGNKSIKSLRLSAAAKSELLGDTKALKTKVSNRAAREWREWLRGSEQTAQVTFDYEAAREDTKVMLLNQTHPLVRAAASYIGKEDAVDVFAQTTLDAVPKGEYVFLVYAWQLAGNRPSGKTIVVCENETVQSLLFTALVNATSSKNAADVDFTAQWDALDEKHYAMWKAEKAKYIAQAQEDCAIRLSQDTEVFTNRERKLQDEIAHADDDKIERMKRGQLDKERANYERRQENIKKGAATADIFATLIMRGVLTK